MEALEGGEIVRLADLGTFQIGLSGRGAETEDAYEGTQSIEQAQRKNVNTRMNFRLIKCRVPLLIRERF